MDQKKNDFFGTKEEIGIKGKDFSCTFGYAEKLGEFQTVWSHDKSCYLDGKVP